MNSRRAFLTRMGAGVSVAVASSAGIASAGTAGRSADPALKAALLEDEKTLRRFHQAYEQAMDQGRYEAVVDLFAHDAQAVFNGGQFDGRSEGVSRLYRERFASGKTGRRMHPAPGFELDAELQRDSVDVAPDRLSAAAVFPFSIQVGRPLESETSLASMARLHGEGVQTWWEGGRYRITYRRKASDDRWQIGRLEYDTLSRADWRAGRSYAAPISVVRLSTRFPADPHGPDQLV